MPRLAHKINRPLVIGLCLRRSATSPIASHLGGDAAIFLFRLRAVVCAVRLRLNMTLDLYEFTLDDEVTDTAQQHLDVHYNLRAKTASYVRDACNIVPAVLLIPPPAVGI